MFDLETPINVDRLQLELKDHPNPAYVNKLCSDCPREFQTSKNLRSALAKPSVISDNLAKEVPLNHVAGPFSEPLISPCRCHLLVWFRKSILKIPDHFSFVLP